MTDKEMPEAPESIAIIGMAGRFPRAQSLDAFWQNIRDGIECISVFSDQELLASGVAPELLRDPNYVRSAAILDDIDQLDAAFFGISPREAECMDPQHRLFLECAWEALENAGYDSETFAGTIGVYAGTSLSTYFANLLAYQQDAESTDGFLIGIGNDKDHLPTRVSYKLNLRGPSVSIQTACSTSLVAVHFACQNLLTYQTDIALAGGVSIRVPQKAGYRYTEDGILSPDGHCRTFDAQAQGTFSGNGVGVVVLKRLSEALADGDCIHAVIRGSAVNNDGSLKVGYTAPSVAGQIEVIATAQSMAGIDIETIGYVEAHGTGTTIGDPIEIAALTQAFRMHTGKNGFCAIGSVKTNIGHLDAAAGVAGLIKTVLALEHRQIPPSLHFERPNPQIDFAASPFYVNTRLSDWRADGNPRLAAVSSFGIGGTNAHVVLEEAPCVDRSAAPRPWQLLILSAKTGSALRTAGSALAEHLRQHPHLNLADVAFTLAVGRRGLKHRRMLVARTIAEAAAALTDQDAGHLLNGTAAQHLRDRPVVFLFSGQGAQYTAMGRQLYEAAPVFRAHLDQCAEILQPYLGLDLRAVLYPDTTNDQRPTTNDQRSTNDHRPPTTDHRPPTTDQRPPTTDQRPTTNDQRHGDTQTRGQADDQAETQNAKLKTQNFSSILDQTWLAQPALFAFEYALAQQWLAWGIRPQAMIGHSIGEYVAACLAGVLALEDALALVAARGRLMQALPSGAMLSIPLSTQELGPYLRPRLSLAAINSPSLCTVSGPLGAVEQLEAELARQQIDSQRLRVSHAFHSSMMDSIVEPFVEYVRGRSLNPPEIPYISNVSGAWITPEEAADPAYWGEHLRQTVRFDEGIRILAQAPDRVLLEIGPRQTLSALVRHHPARPVEQLVLASSPQPHDQYAPEAFLLNTLGQLWLAGVSIDWTRVYAGARRQRIPLPTYPFERQRYWLDPQRPAASIVAQPRSPEQKADVADWFYIPSWKRSMPPTPGWAAGPASQDSRWLVFVDEAGIGTEIARRLEHAHKHVITVKIGEYFARVGEHSYTLCPARREEYAALLDELLLYDRAPNVIVHVWAVTASEPAPPQARLFDSAQARGFYSLLFLMQALDRQNLSDPLRIVVVSNDMQAVTGDEQICPEKATLLGALKVIPQEHHHVTCRSIDIVLPQPGTPQERRLLDRLEAELHPDLPDPVVAYRGQHRWVQTFEKILPREAHSAKLPLREGGVYLITGGLGDIGLVLAEYLATTVRAKLVLIGRSSFPDRDAWAQWLTTYGDSDAISRKIRTIQTIEAQGAEILVLSANVADQEQMEVVIMAACRRFGTIHGVIHGAGVVRGDFFHLIRELDQAEGEHHFEPKALGLLVLDRVLQGMQLDFCCALSSLSAVLGGLGLAAYAAANLFMDAFIHQRNQGDRVRWMSVNWDGWQLDGVGEHDRSMRPSVAPTHAIMPGEGVEAFERVLALETFPQIVISTTDLHARMQRWIELDSSRATELTSGAAAPATHPRPNLPTAYAPPRNAIEQTVVDIWQKLLGIEPIGIDDSFFSLGGDSLLALRLSPQLHQAFEVRVNMRKLMEDATPAGMAAAILLSKAAQTGTQETQRALSEVEQLSAPSDSDTGAAQVPLMPLQHWFFEEQVATDLNHWNTVTLLEVHHPLDPALLKQALRHVILHHEALRLRFVQEGTGWRQSIAPFDGTIPFSAIDLAMVPHEGQGAAIEEFVAQLHMNLHLSDGPLMQVALLTFGPDRPARFVFIIHHLIADLVSWQIILGDLQLAYQRLNQGGPVQLPPNPTSFSEWAGRLTEYAQSEALRQEASYWLSRPWDQVAPPIVDFPEGANLEGAFRGIHGSLDAEETQALAQKLGRSGDYQILDVLLAALMHTFAQWTGNHTLLVEALGHGHEEALFDDVDLSRTVGWLACHTPLVLSLGAAYTLAEELQQIQTQLRQIRHHGIGFGVLRYLSDDAGLREQMRSLPRPRIFFNYLGQTYTQPASDTALFRRAQESAGPHTSPWNIRLHLLYWKVEHLDEQLCVTLEYCEHMYRRSTVEQLLGRFMESIQSFAGVINPGAPG